MAVDIFQKFLQVFVQFKIILVFNIRQGIEDKAELHISKTGRMHPYYFEKVANTLQCF